MLEIKKQSEGDTETKMFKRRLVKKFRNIGRRHTDVMENFSLFNTPKHELFQQLLFKNLLMTITENDCKNIGRRHTKTIESSNIFDTPKQNLFKTILENKVCEYTPKAHDLRTTLGNLGQGQANTLKQHLFQNRFLKRYGNIGRRHTNLIEDFN